LLRGDTTLYAKVVRVGGKEPKVELETLDHRILYCDASLDITKALGSKLYQIVGLLGLAQWDNEQDIIVDFTIKDVTEFANIPFSEAINELSDATKQYYSDVEDVEKYISSMRGSE
jgi:hypothetical protein